MNSMTKTPMPEQDAAIRATNFKEVALGYTVQMAQDEAARCLHCKNAPCVSGCPVNVPIRDFIAQIHPFPEWLARHLRTRLPPGDAVRE